MRAGTLRALRRSAFATAVAAAAWASGCATPRPMIEPAFAERSYTPIRIALMPPDVFVVWDEVGENDPAKSAALGQRLGPQTIDAVGAALRSRGYEVDLRTTWGGVVDGGGNLLVSRDELGWLANSFVSFANSPSGGGRGPMRRPHFVAPELAARVGWATESDALMYLNVKGLATSNGKRAAQVVGAIFFVAIIAAVIIAVVASQGRGGGGPGGGRPGTVVGGGGSRPSPSAMPAPSPGGGAPVGGARWVPPPGHGAMHPAPRGGSVWGGPHVSLGLGFHVPLDGSQHTHDGSVVHEDGYWNGDELYVSMTIVSAHDGRVLWHVRDHVDLDAEDPADARRLAETFIGTIPYRGGIEPPRPTR